MCKPKNIVPKYNHSYSEHLHVQLLNKLPLNTYITLYGAENMATWKSRK